MSTNIHLAGVPQDVTGKSDEAGTRGTRRTEAAFALDISRLGRRMNFKASFD